MPSLPHAPVRHSSLPPSSPTSHGRSSVLGSSPPAPRQYFPLDDSPVTPTQHHLLLSSRPAPSSEPPTYSSAMKTAKPASYQPRQCSTSHSALKIVQPVSSRPRHALAAEPASDIARTEQGLAQLEGQDVHFAIIDNKLMWKKIARVPKYRIKELLMSTLPSVKRQKREVYSKDWLLAQLFHYDLFNTYNQFCHNTQSTEKTLTNMLLMAIENGLVGRCPGRFTIQRLC